MTDPDDMSSVLARYRAAKSPAASATTAAWERMQARLAAGHQLAAVYEADAELAGPVPSPRANQRWIRWGTAALAVAAVVALAVSLDIGGILQSQSGGREPIEAPYLDEPDNRDGVANEADPPARQQVARRHRDDAVEPLVDPAVLPTRDAAALEEPLPETQLAGPTPRPSRRTKRKRSTPEPSTLKPPAPDVSIAAELALLREAQNAISGGNPGRALVKLTQHAANFPGSLMVQERELTRVRALCALGKSDDASKAAARFRRKFSKSHLLPRLNKTCAGEGQ